MFFKSLKQVNQFKRGLVTLLLASLFATGLTVFWDQARAQGKPTPVILVVGDSLSAEYGLERGKGWVALLAQQLTSNKVSHNMVNASISGETTAGGRSRMVNLIAKHKPTHVVIELGANDALRGLPLNQTEANLRFMIDEAQKVKAQILLVGIQIPPNYGRSYTEAFAALFPAVAKSENVALVPFMLEGFADKPEFFQRDRIHPNEKAQPLILATIWPTFATLLGKK
jgi:acyl-CoA thioesterase I